MSEQNRKSLPFWFWIVAVIALLWNVIGCIMFLSEVFAQEAMIESMTEEQKAWARSTPSWIYGVFAISVFSGLAGSVGLLMRKNVSVILFAISFVSILIQMGYSMVLAGGLQVMGPSGAVMPAVVTTLALAWLLFSLDSKRRGWLAG